MDLIDKINDIASRISKHQDDVLTEEATKNAFIMPFISALGYDVFNPMEVIPEFVADVGIKQGEKVDYAIKKDGKIIILMECKPCKADLNKEHASQLYRYFSTTEANFGIITNGIEYRFFSDVDEKNKMDSKPFFEFNVLKFEEHKIKELKKFTKESFSLDDISLTASTLKYLSDIKKILDMELKNPTDAFVRFFTQQVYNGRVTPKVMDQFRDIVKEARKQFVDEQINDRLKSALSVSQEKSKEEIKEEIDVLDIEEEIIEVNQDEIDGCNIIKAILAEDIDCDRVVMRDTKTYMGILLDDNNRKPICRLHFKPENKSTSISLFDEDKERWVLTDSVTNIFSHSKSLKETVKKYDRIHVEEADEI